MTIVNISIIIVNINIIIVNIIFICCYHYHHHYYIVIIIAIVIVGDHLSNVPFLVPSAEAAVRTELMEQVPQIAVLCHEYPEHLGGVVANNLVPMVVKYLTDPNNQVRNGW